MLALGMESKLCDPTHSALNCFFTLQIRHTGGIEISVFDEEGDRSKKRVILLILTLAANLTFGSSVGLIGSFLRSVLRGYELEYCDRTAANLMLNLLLVRDGA